MLATILLKTSTMVNPPAPLVLELLAVLAEVLGWSLDHLNSKLFDEHFVKCLDEANDTVQQQSAWPSAPEELKHWIQKHLWDPSQERDAENITPLQLANEIKALTTTLGSLLLAREGLKKKKSDQQILEEIHDFWVLCTKKCLKDFPDSLLEREVKGQFLPFKELPKDEQEKDLWFLEAIIDTSHFWAD